MLFIFQFQLTIPDDHDQYGQTTYTVSLKTLLIGDIAYKANIH